MQYSEDIELSTAIADKALGFIARHSFPATPRNFEIWYAYASGVSKPLKKSIDQVLAADGKISPDRAQAIYDEHLSPSRTASEVEKLSAQMSGEIAQVTKMIAAAAGNTSSYGGTLDQMSERLSGSVDQESVKSIVETLVMSTTEMEQNNKLLEAQLQDSQDQIANLHQNLEAVRTEALTDQLTGIANRKSFDEQIERLTNEAMEDGTECCLILGDIDHFKKFNDTFGHQTGDQVLRLVARALTSNLKGRDHAARYGGEEFAMLLPQTNMRSALTVADQIRENIKTKELIKKSTGENLGTITMSFGVARYRVGESVENFIERADTCLYAAKDAGRDRAICETDTSENATLSAHAS